MSIPLNQVDLTRIRALIDLIERINDPKADLRIWTSQDYVAIEIKSHNLPINDVRLITGAAPLEADEVQDILRKKQEANEAARRRSPWDY